MNETLVSIAEDELIEEAKEKMLSHMKHLVRKRISLQEKLDDVHAKIGDLGKMNPVEFMKDDLKTDPNFKY